MSEPISLRRSIERLIEGTIRIPGFQRQFVWEPERAALLMDSIYKGYPFGSVLLWRTQNRLTAERRLGVFDLPPPDRDYPIDYVLDGQQRLTSIFTTFQSALTPSGDDPDLWLPIFYDFFAEADAQDSQFVALCGGEEDPDRYFPLSVFFDPVEFARRTRELSDDRTTEIVGVQSRFLESHIPLETFESEDRTSVAIVFERVNRMGVDLDILQLLTAWTWSEEFDLQQKFTDLADEFAGFGFEQVGNDSDLMLRCCAAILLGDPSPSTLVNLNGADVRAAFDSIEDAIRRAIDFLRSNLNVRHIKLLPYESLLVPLAAFFALRGNRPITDEERQTLVRWFWRASLSHRYSGNPLRNIRRDIREAQNLSQEQESVLAEIPYQPDPGMFTSSRFSSRTVATKTFVLMLASLGPLTFLSGESVELDKVLSEPNRSEFHHCYPKAELLRIGFNAEQADAIANFAIISRTENRSISDKAPSEYRGIMPEDINAITQSALIPLSLFEDDYELFLGERAELLAELAAVLAG